MARRSGSGSSSSLRDTVAQRGRQIAEAARLRDAAPPEAAQSAEDAAPAEPRQARRRYTPRAPVPAWLRLVVELLPATTKQQVRDILREPAPEPVAPQTPSAASAELAASREHLRQAREDLRLRESTLDAARAEVERARHAMDATRIELDGRAREIERTLAEARRAAAESAVERLVPRAQIVWSPSHSPRPLRGVSRLAANIRRFGQLTPVVARTNAAGQLEIVSGHRRMAALELAGSTHVRLRLVPHLDDDLAAALYLAENCLVNGVTSKAVTQLAARLGDAAPPGFADVIAAVQADDAEVVEEMTLEDGVEEARTALAEGAAWVKTLRPQWAEIEPESREALAQLILWFARMAPRLRVE